MAIKKSACVIHTINFGSFPGKCMFSVGYTFDEIVKELTKQKLKPWLETFKTTKEHFHSECAGFASQRTLTEKGSAYYFNFLHLRDQFDYSEKSHTILAHEAIHLITFHLKGMLDIVKENEAFAYTHTHILKQCYDAMRPRTKK